MKSIFSLSFSVVIMLLSWGVLCFLSLFSYGLYLGSERLSLVTHIFCYVLLFGFAVMTAWVSFMTVKDIVKLSKNIPQQ